MTESSPPAFAALRHSTLGYSFTLCVVGVVWGIISAPNLAAGASPGWCWLRQLSSNVVRVRKRSCCRNGRIGEFCRFPLLSLTRKVAYFSTSGSLNNFLLRYLAIYDVFAEVPYSAGSTPLAIGRGTHSRRPHGVPGGSGP